MGIATIAGNATCAGALVAGAPRPCAALSNGLSPKAGSKNARRSYFFLINFSHVSLVAFGVGFSPWGMRACQNSFARAFPMRSMNST